MGPPQRQLSNMKLLLAVSSMIAAVSAFAKMPEVDPCACTGNLGKAAKQDYYPVDMGESCAPWDGKMDYCEDNGKDPVPDWCAMAWCYTSPDCPGASEGSYFADIEGPTLYYNYDACDAVDLYSGTDDDPL